MGFVFMKTENALPNIR